MDIPIQFRAKMGVYNDIQIDGDGSVKIKVTVVNHAEQMEKGISELRSLLDSNLPVVGVDCKSYSSLANIPLLLMYVKDRCLIFQLNHIEFLKPLGRFLSDESICFVGFKIDDNIERLKYLYPNMESCLTGKGAEIRTLAAAVLKNPLLIECDDLAELAAKIGFEMKNANKTMAPSTWGAMVFSEGEIKFAVHDVYYCYHIGKKLLGMLL